MDTPHGSLGRYSFWRAWSRANPIPCLLQQRQLPCECIPVNCRKGGSALLNERRQDYEPWSND